MVVSRAAIILTDADELGYQELLCNALGEHASAPKRVIPSEQLLADLRTLAALPDLLTLADDPPSILETPVTVSNTDLLAAMEAADRIRALLPKEDDEG